MTSFYFTQNEYYCDKVSVKSLTEEFPTPFYCYSAARIAENYLRFTEAFGQQKPLTCFAVKANSNLAVLAELAKIGAGADCVSEGEICRALRADIPAQKIVYSGVGKTRTEMAFALKSNIFQFNVESEPELLALNEVAGSLGKVAEIAIRVNPDVDGKTHHKITTGSQDNKFGIDIAVAEKAYALAKSLPSINACAISVHIGSQILSLEPFAQAFAKIEAFTSNLQKLGHEIRRVDLGGGLGVAYNNENVAKVEDYASLVLNHTKNLACQIIVEPGRYLVADAGILVTKVIYIKRTLNKIFVIVDAGMNDLLRPSMYDAFHQIIPTFQAEGEQEEMEVVGPVCESSDVFARKIMLPKNIKAGDFLVIKTCGAYGAVMASTYNSRLLIPEVMVKGNKAQLVRNVSSYHKLMEDENIPNW
jgi:diaminopimelate decarboxylase